MRYGLAALAAVAVGVSAATAAPLRVPARLLATVGPGSTIKLTDTSGRSVRRLRAGLYRIVVRDRSRVRNFHLAGPVGTLDHKTTLRFVGTVVWSVKLVKGSYRFYSDSRPSQRVTFNVI
jgi:hypothetical protein